MQLRYRSALKNSLMIPHIMDNDEMHESKKYTNLSDVYSDFLSDQRIRWIIVIGVVGFFLFQKFGESLHSKLVMPNHKKKMSKLAFGTYVQSIIHAFGISMVSYLTLYKSMGRSDYLVTINETEDVYFYVWLHKTSALLCMSYFIVLTPLELFGFEQSMRNRIVMVIHHIASAIAMPIVVMCNPIFTFFSAFTMQCEISTVFLNLRMFGMVMENKYIYFIGGLGALITYPLTRIVVHLYNIQQFFSKMDVLVDHVGLNGFYLCMLGQVFVLCMSTGYSLELWKRPKRMLFLDNGTSKAKKQQ